jgi:mannitol-specific phosphotransferase system IIBC component
MDMRATEPARNTGAVVGALAAVYVIVNTIWPGLLSENVQSAISEFALIVAPLITAWVIREKVFAPASVGKLQQRIEVLEEDMNNPFHR